MVPGMRPSSSVLELSQTLFLRLQPGSLQTGVIGWGIRFKVVLRLFGDSGCQQA